MTQVTFTLPDGNYFLNPDLALIAGVLADPQRYFTDEGCGEIAIEFKTENIVTNLGIRYVGRNTFSIEWMMARGSDVVDSASIILPRSLNNETIVAYVGGMPLHLPQASVISSEEALTIVTAFCKDGRVPLAWNPIRLSQIPPDVYYWGDGPE